MTKQEEIREGILGLISDYNNSRISYYPDIGTHILGYLHKSGVVIKKEEEIPSCGHLGLSIAHGAKGLCPLLKAGYVKTEPLVEDIMDEPLGLGT